MNCPCTQGIIQLNNKGVPTQLPAPFRPIEGVVTGWSLPCSRLIPPSGFRCDAAVECDCIYPSRFNSYRGAFPCDYRGRERILGLAAM